MPQCGTYYRMLFLNYFPSSLWCYYSTFDILCYFNYILCLCICLKNCHIYINKYTSMFLGLFPVPLPPSPFCYRVNHLVVAQKTVNSQTSVSVETRERRTYYFLILTWEIAHNVLYILNWRDKRVGQVHAWSCKHLNPITCFSQNEKANEFKQSINIAFQKGAVIPFHYTYENKLCVLCLWVRVVLTRIADLAE